MAALAGAIDAPPLVVVGTIALGVGHVAWITIELASIPFSFLIPAFGFVGLALALLPWMPEVKDYLRAD